MRDRYLLTLNRRYLLTAQLSFRSPQYIFCRARVSRQVTLSGYT